MRPPTIEEPESLSAEQQQAVRALAERARRSDGVAPLSEEGLLGLGRDATERRHFLAMADDRAIGYAWLDGPSHTAELVVHPAWRRRGIGTALAVRLRSASGSPLRDWPPTGDDGPRLWAHGDLAAAQALAGRLGLIKVRELWLLRRSLSQLAEPRPLPEGLDIAPFRPGLDDADWLEANAAAFASHPEQGAWRERDLAARLGEDWFDPSAFLLARRDGQLVGYVWLKIVAHDAEIYVLGVVPSAQAAGLGRLLTDVALHEAASRGLQTASLYVDADNARAVALYRAAGFEAATADGQYAYPA